MLYHFSAMSAAGSYQDIIGVLQWSTDCGRSYTKPKIIWPDHGIQHQIVVTIIESRKGEVMVPCDRWGVALPYGPSLGSQSIVQRAPIGRIADSAAWVVNASTGPPATSTQSHHTSLVELRNGSFAAVGRSHDINGTMPYALSTDGGHRWTAKQSSFTGIHGGQREVMIRLGSIDQPLMHCTFANSLESYEGGEHGRLPARFSLGCVFTPMALCQGQRTAPRGSLTRPAGDSRCEGCTVRCPGTKVRRGSLGARSRRIRRCKRATRAARTAPSSG